MAQEMTGLQGGRVENLSGTGRGEEQWRRKRLRWEGVVGGLVEESERHMGGGRAGSWRR